VLSMQSELLGAYTTGIHNLICITGDPPKLGNYPDATAVFDVDAIGLVNIVHNLNFGLDIGGNPIGSGTRFLIGVGANPGIGNIDEEIRRFEYKVEAGAEYAVTQHKDAHAEWLERTRSRGLPSSLNQLALMRDDGANTAERLRRAAGPLTGKLAERLDRVIGGYSAEETARRLTSAETTAQGAFSTATESQTAMRVLEETAGAAISEILARYEKTQQRLSSQMAEQGSAKHDQIEAAKSEATARQKLDEAKRHLQHVDCAPLLFVSALEGTRVHRILELAAELHDEAGTRIPTPQLNEWVQEMQDEHPAPLFHGYPVRFSYAYQVATQPVTIAIQCNRPQAVDDSYKRFLVNRLRDRFQLQVPVRLVLRQKSRSTPRGRGERA